MKSTVYLIPTVLDESAIETIPVYIINTLKNCQVIFAENERTTRRFLKSIDKEIIIDNFQWYAIGKVEQEQIGLFKEEIKAGKNIAIISEAGCPGVADPGQILIDIAHSMNAIVKPLVGPSSLLLALMASGMNGQCFEFIGYLPIDSNERIKKIKELEQASKKNNSTKIFIETPYRNNQLIETVLKNCAANTKFCIAAELTSTNEYIQTKTIDQWRKKIFDFHKKPAIFLLQA